MRDGVEYRIENVGNETTGVAAELWEGVVTEMMGAPVEGGPEALEAAEGQAQCGFPGCRRPVAPPPRPLADRVPIE